MRRWMLSLVTIGLGAMLLRIGLAALLVLGLLVLACFLLDAVLPNIDG